MIAITSLLVVVAIGLLVTRVATVILVATGMSHQDARFQARSAFTGTGFTTSDAESVVKHPVRRRVAMTLMLVGNAGVVAAAGSLILGFRNGSVGQNGKTAAELVVGLLTLLYVSRSRWVDLRLTRIIARLLRRYTDIHTRDVGSLLDLTGNYAVAELAVEEGDWVAGRTLADLGLREEGVAVLGITRQDGMFRGAPVGPTLVRPGDVLLLYGRAAILEEVDRRPAGPAGDQAHRTAVEHQWALVAAEERDDPGRAAAPPTSPEAVASDTA
ncbi:MAG TPA: TrkA C-terminal domain-containing protein [Acidimicrobiales bacterium]|nr:TrkA C-terminal domain-containing protein [Acidimicrobiales bacterium]